MWREARAEEKKMRQTQKSQQREASRRRRERQESALASDPAQLLRITGTACRLRPAPANWEGEASALLAWQGRLDCMIGRWDARSQLDRLPETSAEPGDARDAQDEGPASAAASVSDCTEPKAQAKHCFEAFRDLVLARFGGVGESEHLQRLAAHAAAEMEQQAHRQAAATGRPSLLFPTGAASALAEQPDAWPAEGAGHPEDVDALVAALTEPVRLPAPDSSHPPVCVPRLGDELGQGRCSPGLPVHACVGGQDEAIADAVDGLAPARCRELNRLATLHGVLRPFCRLLKDDLWVFVRPGTADAA